MHIKTFLLLLLPAGQLQVPIPIVQITIFDNETLENKTMSHVKIGDPLTLECTVTAVRGISSSVDIIWTTGGRAVRRVDNITADIESDHAVYTDIFEISSLSAIDNEREFQCTVMINSSQPVNSSDEITLTFPTPVCFDTTYCGGESFTDDELSFEQCCFELSGVSFASPEHCLLCPIDCSRRVGRDIVFVIDTSSSIGSSGFQLVRELTENITINLKRNSPETLFGLITFDDFARFEFNITRHTDLGTLRPAINPGLSYHGGHRTNTARALYVLLSGSVEDGFLRLRNKTSKVAIVITNGYSSSFSSLQSAANSLHAANIYDVYAVGIGSTRLTELQIIASDPSFVFSTRYLTNRTAQLLMEGVIEQLCSTPTPVIILQSSYLQKGAIGSPHSLVCVIEFSSTVQPSSVNLTWNFTSNDNRVTVIPTTITTDDSIGIIYTTVIQFAYLMEGDEGNYTCKLTVEGDSSESIFALELINPVITIEIQATIHPTIYQPLILQCTANIVKDITGTVDIIWTTGDTQVRRVNNVTASSNINSVSLYNDSFITPSLNVSDIGSVYQCEVLINSIVPTTAKSDYIIPIPGSRCSRSLVQDVVFVIDASGSIGSSNFQQIRELTANITARLIHNSPQSRVGVILFSTSAQLYFNLQAYTSLNTLLSAINNLPYSGGGTDIAEALMLLLRSYQLRLRHDSSKTAIIITDGQSHNPPETLSAIAALHASKMYNIFAVGVDGSDLTELNAIASSPEFTFLTSNTVSLQQLQDRIVLQLCIDSFPTISLQPSGLSQNTVGQRQDVICSIYLPPTVDINTIRLGWLYEDDITTDNSRVTVDRLSYNFNNNTLVKSIHFDPLTEEDANKEYICYVIINTLFVIESLALEHLKIPVPLTKITIFDETLENISLGNVTIGDPLTLDCTVTAVRGISSSVDIIWTTGGSAVRRVCKTTANIENDYAIYTDSFKISSLSAFDNGREFQCTVVINANQPVDSSDQITLLFPDDIGITVDVHGAMEHLTVGDPYEIQCKVYTDQIVDSSIVDITWIGPDNDTIIADGRLSVTNFSSGHNHTSTLLFSYLSEDDEGILFTCNVTILSNTDSGSFKVEELSIPPPTVNITIFTNHNKTVGSELSLGCNVTRASGVTSNLTIVWMKNGTPVEEMNDNRTKIHAINSTLQFVYLSEDDEGVYNCSVTIHNTRASGVFSLDEFYVPSPKINVRVISQDEGSRLSLRCDVNTTRGFTSDLDIMWLTSGNKIAGPENVIDNEFTYTLYYNGSDELTSSDNNTVYQCQVLFNDMSLCENLTLNVTKKASIPSSSSEDTSISAAVISLISLGIVVTALPIFIIFIGRYVYLTKRNKPMGENRGHHHQTLDNDVIDVECSSEIGKDYPSTCESLGVNQKIQEWMKRSQLSTVEEECISVSSTTNEEMLNFVQGYTCKKDAETEMKKNNENTYIPHQTIENTCHAKTGQLNFQGVAVGSGDLLQVMQSSPSNISSQNPNSLVKLDTSVISPSANGSCQTEGSHTNVQSLSYPINTDSGEETKDDSYVGHYTPPDIRYSSPSHHTNNNTSITTMDGNGIAASDDNQLLSNSMYANTTVAVEEGSYVDCYIALNSDDQPSNAKVTEMGNGELSCNQHVKDGNNHAPVDYVIAVQHGDVSDDAWPVEPEFLLTHTPNANLPLIQNKANYVTESDV